MFLLFISCHPSEDTFGVPSTQDNNSSEETHIHLSDVQTCDNPSSQVNYLQYTLPVDENPLVLNEHLDGGMIFIGDFDNDGILDVGN